jgi:hypothetical protein
MPRSSSDLDADADKREEESRGLREAAEKTKEAEEAQREAGE